MFEEYSREELEGMLADAALNWPAHDGFARTIDDRIETRCLGCPPDPHPEGWYCAWEFVLRPEEGGQGDGTAAP